MSHAFGPSSHFDTIIERVEKDVAGKNEVSPLKYWATNYRNLPSAVPNVAAAREGANQEQPPSQLTPGRLNSSNHPVRTPGSR
jgi:hypothetical protein